MNPYEIARLTAERLTFSNQHLNPEFVEIGTEFGGSLLAAVTAGFPSIHTIDIRAYRAEALRDKYADKPVRFHCGHSPDVLCKLLPTLKDRITFYLDAHTRRMTPLMDELKVIGDLEDNDHSIIIDDAEQCPAWGLTEVIVRTALYNINPNYNMRIHVCKWKPNLDKRMLVVFP